MFLFDFVRLLFLHFCDKYRACYWRIVFSSVKEIFFERLVVLFRINFMLPKSSSSGVPSVMPTKSVHTFGFREKIVRHRISRLTIVTSFSNLVCLFLDFGILKVLSLNSFRSINLRKTRCHTSVVGITGGRCDLIVLFNSSRTNFHSLPAIIFTRHAE